VFRIFAVLAALLVALPAAGKDDRHVGIYYPKPQSNETYKARTQTLPEANRHARIGFVTNLTNGMIAQNPYPPQFTMFAKGTQGEKLIIIGLFDNTYNTLYRARALLAQLTANARVTPIFQEFAQEDNLTFLDLCKMLGFRRLTISDGKNFAHQILIE
jgi:hypothetical protein